jgi:transposase
VLKWSGIRKYAHNHCDALQRFFDDGRLVLTNNWAERAFKIVATGRKAWLFCGSDDHAKSTAALFSLVSSARLHGLDPEEYLRCLIRLVPLWPAERMIELSPLFWNQTRARLDSEASCCRARTDCRPAQPLDTACSSKQNASTTA